MRYEKVSIISAGAMAGNITSSIIDLRNAIDLSLQFIVSGASSPTGTAAIQFANDCSVDPSGVISGGNFGADAGAAAAPAITANGAKMWNMAEMGHLFCRVVYTAGTGSGTLNVIAATKGA